MAYSFDINATRQHPSKTPIYHRPDKRLLERLITSVGITPDNPDRESAPGIVFLGLPNG